MKFLIIFILSLSFVSCQITPPAINAPVGVPGRKLVYINMDLHEEIKLQIPDYPKKGSAAQSVDEFALRRFQKTRTVEDCERALLEVSVTLENFYGKPYGHLSQKQIEILQPLIDQLRQDGGFYIGSIKRSFNRARPYDYMKDLTPCVPLEKSLAYPSGHAMLATLYALVLADVFPALATQFKERADEIAQDRVLAGVHHPTDIAAGKKFGQIVYNEIIKSPRYKGDIEQYQKLLN
jgi:acid phosphatase (class A)